MAYIRSNLVVRPAYSGIGDAFVQELGGVLDSIGTFVKNTVTAFGETKKAQGAAQANAAAVLPAPVASGGITGTVVAVGAGALALAVILKKRKKK